MRFFFRQKSSDAVREKESFTVAGLQCRIVIRAGQKYLRLRVNYKGDVVVSVPYGVPMSSVEDFVRKNTDWIEKQKTKTVHRTWKTGQTVVLNGSTVVLQVSTGKTNVFQEGSVLYVTVKTPEETQSVRTAVCDYYRSEILTFAENRVPYWCGLLEVEVPVIRTGKAHTRWGVCNVKDRKITFSAMTACLEDSLKDLIVFHEVCHLVCKGHQDDFHRLMQTYMPDVKERERKLRILSRSGATENLF